MGIRTRGGGRKAPPKDESSALKIKLLGRENPALSMQQVAEGLLDTARLLKQHENGYRVKTATLYVTMVDENGNAVRLNDKNELTLYPYNSHADEHGI